MEGNIFVYRFKEDNFNLENVISFKNLSIWNLKYFPK